MIKRRRSQGCVTVLHKKVRALTRFFSFQESEYGIHIDSFAFSFVAFLVFPARRSEGMPGTSSSLTMQRKWMQAAGKTRKRHALSIPVQSSPVFSVRIRLQINNDGSRFLIHDHDDFIFMKFQGDRAKHRAPQNIRYLRVYKL